MVGNSSVGAQLAASLEGLSSMELVITIATSGAELLNVEGPR
jgi:hypothetical protein